jgi:hypothetical protein
MRSEAESAIYVSVLPIGFFRTQDVANGLVGKLFKGILNQVANQGGIVYILLD